MKKSSPRNHWNYQAVSFGLLADCSTPWFYAVRHLVTTKVKAGCVQAVLCSYNDNQSDLCIRALACKHKPV